MNSLSGGFVEDGVIEGPLHQATFDIRTGRCLSPPATADLPTYEVRNVVNADTGQYPVSAPSRLRSHEQTRSVSYRAAG
jgi:hypothetical protein